MTAYKLVDMDLDAFIKSTKEYIKDGDAFLFDFSDNDCPICFDNIGTERCIFLECSPKHFCCESCYSKIDRCMLCRVPIHRQYTGRVYKRCIFTQQIININDALVDEINSQWIFVDVLKLITDLNDYVIKAHQYNDYTLIRLVMKMVNRVLRRHNFYIEDIDLNVLTMRYRCSNFESSVHAYSHITTDANERRKLKQAMERLVDKVKDIIYTIHISI